MNEEDKKLFDSIRLDYGMIDSDRLYENDLKKFISKTVAEALIDWYYIKLKSNER